MNPLNFHPGVVVASALSDFHSVISDYLNIKGRTSHYFIKRSVKASVAVAVIASAVAIVLEVSGAVVAVSASAYVAI